MANPLDRELEKRILEAKYAAGKALKAKRPEEVEKASTHWSDVLLRLQGVKA